MNMLNVKALATLALLMSSASAVTDNAAIAQDVSTKTVGNDVVEGATPNVYLTQAAAGVNALQSWYVPANGLYQTTAWWNSANAVTVLANYSTISGSKFYLPVLQNTFTQAQKLYPGFLNHFYDDEGWWALAWIAAYDVTTDQQYLSMAQSIFADMAGGWDVSTCGGGIWWNKDRRYKNAIANELFLSAAAQLANRIVDPAQKAHYLTWAKMEWQWFRHSGMINSHNLINDGLDSSVPSHCVNNGQAVWSYNQGVVLGGLVDFGKAGQADPTLLASAKVIADAALLHLTDANGVLHDQGELKGGAGGGGVQFKGVFVRNLVSLDERLPKSQYSKFFTVNADSIWNNARGSNYQFGQVWSGPYNGASAGSQSSALDTFIAAVEVTNSQRLP